PYGRLLNRMIRGTEALRNVPPDMQRTANPNLGVVIVLPPHADSDNDLSTHGAWTAAVAHKARRLAIDALYEDLTDAQQEQVIVSTPGCFAAPQPATDGFGFSVHEKSHVYAAQLVFCGWANTNRRSFVGDSELALAVYDPSLAHDHLHNLWDLFFNRQ